MSVTTRAAARPLIKTEGLGDALLQGAFGAVGFILSGASIMGVTAPFGAAWAGAAPKKQALSASAGALFGYLFLLHGSHSLRYMACVLMTLALRWVFFFVSQNNLRLISPLFSAVSVAITGLAVLISGANPAYGALTLFCDSAITATSGMIFVRALIALKNGEAWLRSNRICTGILLAALYMGLCSFNLFFLSPARICAFALILCCACFSGGAFAAAAAMTAGLCSALAGEPYMLAVFCCGGLAAGVFAPLGRALCALSLAAASLLALAAQGEATLFWPLAAECAAAAVILLLLSPKQLRFLGLCHQGDTAEGQMLKKIVVAKLSRAKNALCDIAAVTSEVSKKLEEAKGDNLEALLAKACTKVCRGCKSSPRCWQSEYNSTCDALNHLFAAARAGNADINALPEHFNCERSEELLTAVNSHAQSYLSHRMQTRYASQLRNVSDDQFSGMGLLLASLEEQLCAYRAAEDELSGKVKKYLLSLCGGEGDVCCCRDGDGRISIMLEAPLYKMPRLLSNDVADELSEMVQQDLCRPECIGDGDSSRILWEARPIYKTDCAFLQQSANGNRYCGDSVSVTKQLHGRAILLLCDGMGVGSPAAVDATMTASMLERLLAAGADFNAALRLANAALLSGGGEERLCTIDCSLIDLFGGKSEFYKSGAAPTFIYKDGSCTKLDSSSLPAGILGGVTAAKSSVTLFAGDMVVMISDGVIENGCDWLLSEISANAKKPPQELCEHILKTARDRRLNPEKEDDMSVIVCRIEEDE